MCGIAGQYFFNNQRANKEGVEKAINDMVHRGPDNQSCFLGNNVALGHARLAILDLNDDANQPLFSDDRRHVLIFNGELYNYLKLKQEMNLDRKWRTSSDTEVLLYWLIKHGKEGLKHLNGFFALAFFDLDNKQGFIARDYMGIKPLCYSANSDSISFGSGVKQVAHMLDQVTIDKHAVGQYLQFTYIPAPSTIYNEVKKLRPGEIILIDRDKSPQSDYFKPAVFSEPAPSVRDALEKSVRLRLQSDVPLGTFLSGGIDSSIISALAKKDYPEIRTYSIGFKQGVFDESDKAKKVAAHIGSKHTTIQLDSQTTSAYLDDLVEKLDEPFADSSSAAVYALCKHVKSEITVALSGDGADELFAGYKKHQALKMTLNPDFKQKFAGKLGKKLPIKGNRGSRFGNKIRQLKKWGELSGLSPTESYIRLATFTDPETVSSLMNSGYDSYHLKTEFDEDFADFLLMDQELVLPNDMLMKVDKMSMANSLEVRVPFLDVNVVHASRNLSSQQLFEKGINKPVLFKAFGSLLPKWVFTHDKHGFEIPVKSWLQENLKKEFEHQLSEAQCIKFGLIQFEKLERIKAQFYKKSSGDLIYTLWAVFILHKWLETHHA